MRAFADLADEDRCQQREDERLKERNEDFEDTNGDCHGDRRWYDIVRAEREDQADEGEEHHVAGGHVGEETDRECERLRELPDDFNRRHDERHGELHGERHIVRPVYYSIDVAFPECPHTSDFDHDKRDDGECGSDGDVSGGC